VSSDRRPARLSACSRVNLNFQVLPGYLYVIEGHAHETGEFSIVCNEFCGLGHHLMTGRIIVVD
jgi:cytochrome c oxidase subunit II